MCRSSIGKHPQSSCIDTVFLANEVGVQLPNDHDNLHEQLSVHVEMALKYHLVLQWIISEVVSVQHAITLQPLSWLALVLPWF
jgi:hypothetical protein